MMGGDSESDSSESNVDRVGLDDGRDSESDVLSLM